MTIEYANYKGQKVVKEKTEIQSYITTPIFASKDIDIKDVKINKNLKEAVKILQGDDKDPFYFISEMKYGEDFPTSYDDIMSKEWADSFIGKLDVSPFPMSVYGHVNITNPMERAENQGYVIGGKVDDKKKSMFLLNYLIAGDSDQSKELADKTKREIKAGMLSTSISNLQKYVRIYDEEQGESTWIVTESLTGQRNDIVEHDLTGSDAAIVARSLKSNNAEKSVTKNKGDKSMDKKEMLLKLQTLKGNGELSIADIANTFSLKLETKEITESLKALKSITDEAGEGVDVISLIKEYKTLNAKLITAEFDKNKQAALKETFKDKENVLEYATELFSLKSGDEKECIEEAKRVSEMKVLKDLSSKMVSSMSKGVSFKTDMTGDNESAKEDDVS